MSKITIHITIEDSPLAEAIGAGGKRLGTMKARGYLADAARVMISGESRAFGKAVAELMKPKIAETKRYLDAAKDADDYPTVEKLAAQLADDGAAQAFFRAMGEDDGMAPDDTDPVPSR